MEQMVGQALGGPGRVRAWLLGVAAGRPVGAAAVATVEGYSSCALATEVGSGRGLLLAAAAAVLSDN